MAHKQVACGKLSPCRHISWKASIALMKTAYLTRWGLNISSLSYSFLIEISWMPRNWLLCWKKHSRNSTNWFSRTVIVPQDKGPSFVKTHWKVYRLRRIAYVLMLDCKAPRSNSPSYCLIGLVYRHISSGQHHATSTAKVSGTVPSTIGQTCFLANRIRPWSSCWSRHNLPFH